MPDFDAQNTDRENSKAPPTAVARDNDLKSSNLGSMQQIARDRANQNTVAGSGATPVDARIK